MNVAAGHGRQELADAAANQMQQLAYCSGYAGSSNQPAIELAERLAALTYPSINRFFFTSGGGEASEMLQDALQRRLDLPCELGDPLRSYGEAASGPQRGQWDVAAGLALRDVN